MMFQQSQHRLVMHIFKNMFMCPFVVGLKHHLCSGLLCSQIRKVFESDYGLFNSVGDRGYQGIENTRWKESNRRQY